MDTNQLTVVDGVSRELVDHEDAAGAGAVVPMVSGGRTTPPNQRIPLQDGDTPPDWDYGNRTPKEYRRVATKDNGEILYRYVPIVWVLKALNGKFHYQWGLELISEEWGDKAKTARGQEYIPYNCVVQLVAPGMFRPVIGVGSSNFYTANPQESIAKTRNAALSAALKAAAKQLGIGRDVEEDDTEIAGMIGSSQRTIQTLYDKLVERDKAEAAREVIRKYEPSALLDSGALLVGAISTEHLEVIQRGLSQAAATRAVAEVKA
jgi:hypothetical protein